MALTKVTGHVVQPDTNIQFHNTKSTGIITATDTTQSTSTTTGALQIAGGVGIAKNLNVGGNANISGVLTYEDVTNIDAVGIITAQAGIHFGIGATAGKFDALTGITTFSGNLGINQTSPTRNLHIDGTAHQSGIIIHTAGNHSTAIDMDSNRSSAGNGLAEINFKWDGTTVGQIGAYAGSDTSNKDDAVIHFDTASAGSALERLRIESDGKIKFSTNNSTTDYFQWGANPRLWLRCPDGINGLRIDANTTPIEIRNSDATGRSYGIGGGASFDMSVSGDYSLSSSGHDSSPKVFFNATRHNGSTTVTSFQTSIQAVSRSNTSNDGYLGLGGSASPDDLIIDTSGRIGINTTTPENADSVQIFGTTTPMLTIKAGATGSDANRRATLMLWTGGNKTYKFQADASDGGLKILDSSTERFVVTSAGHIGINGATATNNRVEIIQDPKGFPSDSAQPNATILIKHGTTGTSRRWVGIGASLTGAWLQSSSPGGTGLAAPFWINRGGGDVSIGSGGTKLFIKHASQPTIGVGTNTPVGNLDIRDTKANLIVAKTGLTVKGNSDLSTTYDMIQLGAGGALASYSTATATADTELIHNAYRHSGNNWKYRYQDTAMRLLMNSPGRAFVFQSAASGNADADITFEEKFRIETNSAKFTVGTNKTVKFYAASHNDETNLGAGIGFSRQSDGAELLSGIFGHSNTGLGVAARDHVTILTGGTSNVSDTEERLRITSTGDMGLGCTDPGADPAIGNDATVFEIRQTTTGNITSGNNRKGAVLRLKHEAQWENGYQSSSPNDDLGRVEFVTGDSSVGEGVRSIIRTRNLQYFNHHALTFETAYGNSTTISERLRLVNDVASFGNDSPPSWQGGGGYYNLQLGNAGYFRADTDASSNFLSYGVNAYRDGSGWKFVEDGRATQVSHGTGTNAFTVYTSNSGNADNTPTFTERFLVRSDGIININSNANYGSNPGVLNIGRRSADPGAVTVNIARGEAIGGGTGPVLSLIHGPDGGTQRVHNIYSYVGDLRVYADAAEDLHLRGYNTKIYDADGDSRVEVQNDGDFKVTNPGWSTTSSPSSNCFQGMSQLGHQHWGHRQYYSKQFNLTQNGTVDLISNNTAHDDIIFWLNVKGYHANRTFATVHGTIGGYGITTHIQSGASGAGFSLSAANLAYGRNMLRFTSTSSYGAQWWVWGWISGTSGTGTHTGMTAKQLNS